MDTVGGVGLSAPQVNQSIRIFMIDSSKGFQQLGVKEKEAFPGDIRVSDGDIRVSEQYLSMRKS